MVVMVFIYVGQVSADKKKEIGKKTQKNRSLKPDNLSSNGEV